MIESTERGNVKRCEYSTRTAEGIGQIYPNRLIPATKWKVDILPFFKVQFGCMSFSEVQLLFCVMHNNEQKDASKKDS